MIKVTKEQFQNPCANCGQREGTPALCCQAFVVDTPIDPSYPDQVHLDMLHWYLVRGCRSGWTVWATFPAGVPTREAICWQILVHSTCPMLDENGGCTIYEHRPAICREYPPFPSYRENDPVYQVTGCERYDPEPEPDYVFADPFTLVERLAEWFDYDPAVHVKYVPDMQSVKITTPSASASLRRPPLLGKGGKKPGRDGDS